MGGVVTDIAMSDKPITPLDLLKRRLADMLDLLDRHDLTLAAAWLAMAIEAMPGADDR